MKRHHLILVVFSIALIVAGLVGVSEIGVSGSVPLAGHLAGGCGGEPDEEVGKLTQAGAVNQAGVPNKGDTNEEDSAPIAFKIKHPLFENGCFHDSEKTGVNGRWSSWIHHGERCKGAVPCEPKHACVTMAQGVEHGYCLEKCDPNAPACSGGAECVKLTSDGACMPLGTAAEDTVCGGHDPNADKLDLSKDCKLGMACVGYRTGDEAGVCLRQVDPTTCPKTCTAGRVCLSLLDGAAVCVFPCGQPEQKCPAGLKCVEVAGGKFCLAP